MNIFFMSLVVLLSLQVHAGSHKPEVGIGYTNNVNYEDANTDSDFYIWLRNYSSKSYKKNHYSVWLMYKDYLQQSEYDAFTWRLGALMPGSIFKIRDWSIDLGVGGQHFMNSNPGTTEEGFDNVYVDMAAIKSLELNNKLELSLEPGYQLKIFTDLQDRMDHRFYFNALADYMISSKQTISPYAELGLIFSNESVYRRNYLELGFDWSFLYKKNLKFGAGYILRYSSYPNRTVSTETVVSRNRNRNTTTSQTENETHTYSQLQGFIVKIYRSFDLKGSMNVTSQTSKSGFENYTEFGAKASLIFAF